MLMDTATNLNNVFKARLARTGYRLLDQACDVIERPVSYAASLGWPVCTATASHWAATQYLSADHPLTPVATGLVVCSEAAQWYAHKRYHELQDIHKASEQAASARQISLFLGAMLSGLYSLAIWQAAAAGGLMVSGWGFGVIAVLGIAIAWAGYTIKFALCDAPTHRPRRQGSADQMLAAASTPAAPASGQLYQRPPAQPEPRPRFAGEPTGSVIPVNFAAHRARIEEAARAIADAIGTEAEKSRKDAERRKIAAMLTGIEADLASGATESMLHAMTEMLEDADPEIWGRQRERLKRLIDARQAAA